MPFNYLLTNLLADIPGALGAIFLDHEGEAIEWVTRHGEPYEIKVEGAFHSVFKRRLGAPLEEAGGGPLRSYELAGERLTALTRVLCDGYYVVLVMERGGPTARARHRLEHVARILEREIG